MEMERRELPRNNLTGNLDAYSWPGLYPIYYITRDGGVLCPECANAAEREGLTGDEDDPQWDIIAAEVQWEGEGNYCDNCNAQIEVAYPEELADTIKQENGNL